MKNEKNNFYEIRFLAENSLGSSGGPEFSTDILTSLDLNEYRNINWSTDRNRYNLAPAIKTRNQLEYLISFFRICKGRATGFRFKDWNDFQVINEVFNIADEWTNTVQIVKTYAVSGVIYNRKIVKPVKGSLLVKLNGRLVNPEVDYSNGLIKFDNKLIKGDKIEYECEFDVPVRFDIDSLMIVSEGKELFSNQEIPLIELKL